MFKNIASKSPVRGTQILLASNLFALALGMLAFATDHFIFGLFAFWAVIIERVSLFVMMQKFARMVEDPGKAILDAMSTLNSLMTDRGSGDSN